MRKINLAYFLAGKTSVFVSQNASVCAFTNFNSWVVLHKIENQIKDKIESISRPLKEWDVHINYGIKTGFNEAFIIDSSKRTELLEEDPKSAEIIRPILRGRDIKRYSYEHADLWLISTFPSLKIDIEHYPAIKRHLLGFGYDRLKQTGDLGARKKTNNKWFETQDSISYWDDFSKQKIIWIELADKGRFALDYKDGFVTLNGTFIMIGQDLEYLCCILNNPITSWHFNTFCISSGVGTNQWRELYVKELMIPKFSQSDHKRILDLFSKVVQNIDNNSNLIKDINEIVYHGLQLTEEEIEFIENQ